MTVHTSTCHIDEMLPLCPGDMVALVGSGGKTSLMYSLGKAYAHKFSVVCTTTTKLWKPAPEQSPFLLLPNLHNFAQLSDPSLLTVARALETPSKGICRETQKEQNKKMPHSDKQKMAVPGCGLKMPPEQDKSLCKVIGYAPDVLEYWWQTSPADLLIIEADGSAGRPLKAHAAKEPVIPPNTRYVIAVAGLCGLGKPLTKENVWRPEIFASLSGLKENDIITAKDLAEIIVHPDGLFTKCPPEAEKILFLNGLELPGAEENATILARLVFQNPQCPVKTIYSGSALMPEKECLCLRP